MSIADVLTAAPSTTANTPAPSPTPAGDPAPWWRQAAVYQIYPRSFADANGDGLGDIPGITSKADYLQALGIDAVWLSPFYPSALADGGYDVADYRNVDPRLGTLADFDTMLGALHSRGIRVVVDIVPNHTSDQHAWFQQAVAAAPGSVERQRYLFREGQGADGALPPTDWVSAFGGSAWHRVPDGQWYLHSFAIEQPDLNWANPEVHADFVTTLRFWSDRGVDGFRIDVAHMLTKNLTEPLPSQAELDALPRDGQHPLLDRDDVHEIYAEWRQVFNSYDPPRTAVAEAWVDKARVPLYASPDSLGQAFNFDLLEADFDAAQFEAVVRDNLALAEASGSSSTWVLSNHDVVRHASRYGLPQPARSAEGHPLRKHGADWVISGGVSPVLDRAQGERRARAATLFLLGLPGSSYLYQGEELGLHEVAEIAPEARQDPTFFRSAGTDLGRDGCRVPLPWDNADSVGGTAESSSETSAGAGSAFGFGTGGSHLPQPAWFADYTVAGEANDPESTLALYRNALALRHTLQTGEHLEWIPSGRADVLRYRRPNGWDVVTNFGTEPYPLGHADGVDRHKPLLTSRALDAGTLPGESTAWFGPATPALSTPPTPAT